MNYEDQIREMAKAIYKSGVAIDATDIAFGLYDTDTHFHRMATKLYAAGYGKVKQAVKETVRAIYEEVEKIPYHNLSDEEGRGYVLAISAVLTALKKYESEEDENENL